MHNTTKHYFLSEPILNSELILVNNSKKLKEHPELLNEEHLERIQKLRDEFIALEQQTEAGVKGLRKQKTQIRNEIRDLSFVTYTNRDTDLFGRMILTMADKIVQRGQFSNYTFKEEMKSLGIQYILLYTYKFDPYKRSTITGQYASAFAYISTILFNACIATINKFKLDQIKAKEEFLERQKLIHREPNKSTIGLEYEETLRAVNYPNLEAGQLLPEIKKLTITEPVEFWIPGNYKINEKEYTFILKYIHNISIRRI